MEGKILKSIEFLKNVGHEYNIIRNKICSLGACGKISIYYWNNFYRSLSNLLFLNMI